MKSIMVLLTAVMVALVMSAPVALAAAPIYCTQAPDAQPDCKGTNGNDVMYGYDNDNKITRTKEANTFVQKPISCRERRCERPPASAYDIATAR